MKVICVRIASLKINCAVLCSLVSKKVSIYSVLYDTTPGLRSSFIIECVWVCECMSMSVCGDERESKCVWVRVRVWVWECECVRECECVCVSFLPTPITITGSKFFHTIRRNWQELKCLVSCGCGNKWPQTGHKEGDRKQNKFIILQFWKLEVRNQGVEKPCPCWRLREVSLAVSPGVEPFLVTPGDPWRSLVILGPQMGHHCHACLHRPLATFSVSTAPLWLCPKFSLLIKITSH